MILIYFGPESCGIPSLMPSGSQQMGIVWVGHNLFDHTNEDEDPVIQFYHVLPATLPGKPGFYQWLLIPKIPKKSPRNSDSDLRIVEGVRASGLKADVLSRQWKAKFLGAWKVQLLNKLEEINLKCFTNIDKLLQSPFQAIF